MKDKIYVHIGHHLGLMQASTLPTSAPGEEEYIRKKALLEWLDYLKGKVVGDEKRVLVLSIIDKINSL